MNAPATRFETFWKRIKNNPVIAVVMIIGVIIMALSSFTDATRNLWGLMPGAARAPVNGIWHAELNYPGTDSSVMETLNFRGTGDQVEGLVTYRGKEQVLLEGRLSGNRLEFTVKTEQFSPDWNVADTRLATHRYSGRVTEDEIHFVMETKGGYASYPPFQFVATRASEGGE